MFHLHYWFLKVQYMGQLRYGQRERETKAYDWKELFENNIFPLKKPEVSFQELVFVILSSI